MPQTGLQRIYPALAYVTENLDQETSLATLAFRARLSPYHLHRVFAATTGETPKQFTLRLRLARGAVRLLTGHDSITRIALDCGFQSHEVFCRAFRRVFSMSPGDYRKRGFLHPTSRSQRVRHAEVVNRVAGCVGLYRISDERKENHEMPYSITAKEIAPQPVLLVRCRIQRSEIAATIATALPMIFHYAQQQGIALAGHPFARYSEVGAGLMTIEPGMMIAAGQEASAGAGDVIGDTLPGGMVAYTTHLGPYDKLSDAYGALEQWIGSQGWKIAGAPWEYYVSDPAEVPDPKDWKTDVFWPISR